MLRAISEIAVAITVTSTPVNPQRWARVRTHIRAVTMSASLAIAISRSPAIDVSRPRRAQMIQALVQVEPGGDIAQPQAELHHGEGDPRLDADDHGVGSAQTDRAGQLAE